MHNRTTRPFFLPKSVIRVLASIIRLPTFLMTYFIVVMPRLPFCRYTRQPNRRREKYLTGYHTARKPTAMTVANTTSTSSGCTLTG